MSVQDKASLGEVTCDLLSAMRVAAPNLWMISIRNRKNIRGFILLMENRMTWRIRILRFKQTRNMNKIHYSWLYMSDY